MFNFFKKREEEKQTKKTNFLKTLAVVLPAFALVAIFGTLGAFAEGGTVAITVPAIPPGLFDSILSALGGYITAILPFGLKVMGTYIAVGFIPRLIYKFV